MNGTGHHNNSETNQNSPIEHMAVATNLTESKSDAFRFDV